MTEAQGTPRVAVLMGGPSAEHDISMMSGQQVMVALGHRSPVGVVIDRHGGWTIDGRPCATVGQALDELSTRADVVFIALHGQFGEDGTVQAILQTFGLPYTGSGVLASALAMDKARTKHLYGAAGLPTADFVSIEAHGADVDVKGALDVAEARLGFPCVVKPAHEGSSVGIFFPEDRGAMEAGVTSLLGQGYDVLLERKIVGRELTCGVLEIAAESRSLALPVTEIIPNERYAFFDYEAKYTPGATQEITPAQIDDDLRDRIQALALEAHRVLGCRDFSRTDVMVEPDGALILLETNTIPGLTKASLVPQEAAAAGIDFGRLVEILVDNAWRRAV